MVVKSMTRALLPCPRGLFIMVAILWSESEDITPGKPPECHLPWAHLATRDRVSPCLERSQTLADFEAAMPPKH